MKLQTPTCHPRLYEEREGEDSVRQEVKSFKWINLLQSCLEYKTLVIDACPSQYIKLVRLQSREEVLASIKDLASHLEENFTDIF